MVGLFCTYGHQFLYGNERKISQYCQSPLILLKCMRGNNIYILFPFNILFVSNQTILKRKSLCLKTIETIAILKRLLSILLTLPLSYNCSNRLLLPYIDSPMYCYIPRKYRPFFDWEAACIRL